MWESRVLRRAFERLELHEGKLSRAVLRGGGGGDVTSLPDPGWATTQVYPARNSPPDSGCDFTQSNLRLLRDANQNVGVIAQKHPVKVGRVPTQFIYLALTPAQTSRTNYTNCGTYIISLRVRLARTSSSYHNYWAGAIQKTVICGS